jgi:5-formyltetrahydrofolate cyclo-ligase
MRGVRGGLTDREERSQAITEHLDQLAVVRGAANVMLFASLSSEPRMEQFADRCAARGQRTMVPEDDPDPRWPDVVVVPGLAFTVRGERLGQGGGWYDRFLLRTRPGCALVGVAFDPQIVDALPTEDHDVTLDGVATETCVWWVTSGGRR